MYNFVVIIASTMINAHVSVIIFAIFYLKFWIKMSLNLPLIPTIQKLDRAFMAPGFAAQLKPHAFD
jgi:hypothetical protein